MSDQATATENGKPALPAIAEEEIQKVRRRGAVDVALKRELNTLARQLEGMEWGSVSGRQLSPHTRYGIAQICQVTGANPQLHIDILGGSVYLNADFWEDRINSDPHFHHFEQREISERTEEALRARAASYREAAEGMEPKSQQRSHALVKALDLEEEADSIERARLHFSPPEWATSVYETTIVRFINAAPMDAIRRGEIEDIDAWLIEVTECNWAGNRPEKQKKSGGTYQADPIGNEEPEKTARTRSLRRAAAKAFPAWMPKYEQQVQEIIHAVEAEFEILEEDAAERRQLQAGPLGASTDGEPAAAAGADAEDLPGTREPTPREEAPDPQPDEEWDRESARKRYFAMLHESGVADSKRKAWQKAHELPVSTSDWTRADYNRAFEALIAPHRDAYFEACEQKGVEPEDFAFEEIHSLPGSIADFQKLNARLAELEDAPAQGELV